MGNGAFKAHQLYSVTEELHKDGGRDLQFWLQEEKTHLEKMVGGEYVPFHGHHLSWSCPALAFIEILLRPHSQSVDWGLPIWHLNLGGSAFQTFEYADLWEIQSWMRHLARTWNLELDPHITRQESEYLHINKMQSFLQFKKLHYLRRLKYRMIAHWMETEWREILADFKDFVDKPELNLEKNDSRICFSMSDELSFSVLFDCYDGKWTIHFSPTLDDEESRNKTFPPETDMREALQPYKEHLLFNYNRLILEAYSKE